MDSAIGGSEVTINKREDGTGSSEDDEDEPNQTDKGGRQSSPLEKPQVIDTKIIGGQ